MDVVAYCNDGTEYLIDVSARNPLANRYRHGASTQAGYACGRGEYDKERRYPTRRGKQVIPCIVESFGKLGGKFLDFMDQAGVHAIVSGAHGSSQPRHIKGRWLTDISSVINKCVARCYKSAAHGSQGRRTALEGLLRPPVSQDGADPSLLLPPPPHVASTHNIRSVAPGLQLHLDGPAEPSRCPVSAFPAAAAPFFPPPAPGSPGSPCILSTFTPFSQRTVASCSVLPSTQLTSTPSSQFTSFASQPPHAVQAFSSRPPSMSGSNLTSPHHDTSVPQLPGLFLHPLGHTQSDFIGRLAAAAPPPPPPPPRVSSSFSAPPPPPV